MVPACMGDDNRVPLYGFSGGGQFVGRFTWAHPDRVNAVGGGTITTRQVSGNADNGSTYFFFRRI